ELACRRAYFMLLVGLITLGFVSILSYAIYTPPVADKDQLYNNNIRQSVCATVMCVGNDTLSKCSGVFDVNDVESYFVCSISSSDAKFQCTWDCYNASITYRELSTGMETTIQEVDIAPYECPRTEQCWVNTNAGESGITLASSSPWALRGPPR